MRRGPTALTPARAARRKDRPAAPRGAGPTVLRNGHGREQAPRRRKGGRGCTEPAPGGRSGCAGSLSASGGRACPFCVILIGDLTDRVGKCLQRAPAGVSSSDRRVSPRSAGNTGAKPVPERPPALHSATGPLNAQSPEGYDICCRAFVVPAGQAQDRHNAVPALAELRTWGQARAARLRRQGDSHPPSGNVCRFRRVCRRQATR